MFSVYFAFLFGICFVFLPQIVRAANLYFFPSSGSPKVNGSLSVSVFVSSDDQTMNAASGVVTFPADKLEVSSVSKSDSIFSLWVQEPSYSNTVGNLNFEGIVLNPGFIGSSGRIITINFQVKAAGTAVIGFGSGSILANDGQGTNILNNMGKATFSLEGIEPLITKIITPPKVIGTPDVPEIFSPTHPDSDKWYANNNPKFTWKLKSDITAARLLLGKIPNVDPTVYYSPAVSSKEFPNLDDGTWYFHVRLKNENDWGPTVHYLFKIDTQKPEYFNIEQLEKVGEINAKIRFKFDAYDKTSGIDHFEIQTDDGEFENWKGENNIYETEILKSGKHMMNVRAVDYAGNFLVNSTEFELSALNSPMISDYEKELIEGEAIIVKGNSYPDSRIRIWSQYDNQDAEDVVVRSDENGDFTVVVREKIQKGLYTMWAEVLDEDGNASEVVERLSINVYRPKNSGGIVYLLTGIFVTVVAIAFVLLFFILMMHILHKFSSFKKKTAKEFNEARQTVRSIFYSLNENIYWQIKFVEKIKNKKELLKEEEKIIKEIKKDLNEAEHRINKKLSEIEKKLK